MQEKLFRIKGAVQPYDWGGYSYIRALLGDSLRPDKPSAEYWLGTHANAPSMTIEESGERELSEKLNALEQPPISFLMKILDVRMMLSIQVHPSIPQAEEGYAREDAAGIPLTASNRTYKDKNHKPELMFALSRFWMLHGLRSPDDLLKEFRSRPSCAPLETILINLGIKGLVSSVLDAGNAQIQSVVDQLLLEIGASGRTFEKSCPEFWIQRWLEDNPGVYTGVLMILLMHVIELQPGEAVYQPAQLLHAYLEGQNIEIMANSDNVLRAGLTSKHIDADELVRIANLQPTNPGDYKVAVRRNDKGIRKFDTPFQDFLLQEIEIPPEAERQLISDRHQVLLFFSGERLIVSADMASLDLIPGECCFSCIGNEITFKNPTSRTAQVFIGS